MKRIKDNSLLIEICSQDIPARMQAKFGEQFKNLLISELKKKQFLETNATAECECTPSRVYCIINGIKKDINVKGPKIDASSVALEGFLKKYSIPSVTNLTIEDKYYTYQDALSEEELAKMLSVLVPSILQKAVNLWPKRMHWSSSHTANWIRLISNIVCLLNSIPVPFIFAGISSSNTTLPNKRLLMVQYAKTGKFKHIIIPSAFEKGYKKIMQKNSITLSKEERQKSIINQISQLNLGIDSRISSSQAEATISLMSSMVENPYILYAEVPEKFLELPFSILATTLIKHQFYILAKDTNTQKLVFCFVVDGPIDEISYTKEAQDTIIQGNLKVVNARLEDALFFHKEDEDRFAKIRTLVEMEVELDKMQISSKLGTLKNRCQRIYNIAKCICGNSKAPALMQIYLTQLDLVTSQINELPELQGTIGREYLSLWWHKAKAVDFKLTDEEQEQTKEIIQSQYNPSLTKNIKPSFSSDTKVKNVLLINLALSAILLESLLSHLIEGHTGNSSSDPYGLCTKAYYIIYYSISRSSQIQLDLCISMQDIQVLLEECFKNVECSTWNTIAEQASQLLVNAATKYLNETEPNTIKEELEQEGIYRKVIIKNQNLKLIDMLKQCNREYDNTRVYSQSKDTILAIQKRTQNLPIVPTNITTDNAKDSPEINNLNLLIEERYSEYIQINSLQEINQLKEIEKQIECLYQNYHIAQSPSAIEVLQKVHKKIETLYKLLTEPIVI